MSTVASVTTRAVQAPGTTESTGPTAAAAGAVLAIALCLGWMIRALQAPLQQQTERAVLLTGVLLGGILITVPGVYLLRMRANARPEVLGIVVLSTLAMLLLAVYFFWVGWYVFFPADIWIWSEGDFVNDIMKFSTGYPLYSAPANHDSYTYVPGAQLLTYFIAWPFGKVGSIPFYRLIQLGYTAAAAFVATLSCRLILRVARPGSRVFQQWFWSAFCYAACFLMATNSITNRFTHNLHGDALAQLVNMVAFYLLLRYIETRSRRVLWAMALLVPLGFLVKQNLLIWGVLYAGFLVVWGGPWRRLVLFSAAAGALFGVLIATCYAIWGHPFYYWTFYLLAHHAVSPLRSFQHVLDTWAYYAAVLLGGLTVLRDRKPDALTGAWLISIGLLCVETYTSGIAWMLNHIGPGSLLAGVWFLAGLASVWNSAIQSAKWHPAEAWIRAGVFTTAVALMFSGMGLVRVPLRPVSDDAYRYVHDIEREFAGKPANRILLDVGDWVYLKDRVIMRDRAPCIGEEGYANSGDFSGFLSRIRSRYYSKILVRDLHEYDFWYENAQWPKPRGLRQAILDSYRETGRIRAAAAPKDVKHWAEDPYLFDEITILQPKPDADGK